MASTVPLHAVDSSFEDGRSPSLGSNRRVYFSDHEKEADDDCSFNHNESTLQWESTMNNSLSDDVKLATVATDCVKELPEVDSTPYSDEGLGTLSSNKEGSLSDVFQGGNGEAQEGEDENLMPELASQVFVHVVSGNHSLALDCRDRDSVSSTGKKKKELSEMYGALEMGPLDPEKQVLLCQSPSSDLRYSMHPCRAGSECSLAEVPEPKASRCNCQSCTPSSLKAVASFIAAIVIFPCFLYGAYVFLPFDVPLMTTIGNRLIYTLRCGVFATFPIVLGLIVYGISRLCASSFDPFGKREREVEIHRRYATQSVYLFVLYFFNMAVLATYLPQELLKLVPLLTGLFALSRLIYWLAFAMGRSFRGFGYGLTFLPLAAMLLANLYFMFIMDPQNIFAVENAAAPDSDTSASSSKLRMWG
ncbi:transmembrane protein 79 [Ambystoma mexicanum]|uniref:transmembrane protein 79 n=1 Tax=Ambystoma mexicanum TaxID=8296 RepID=UPI0037E99D97